MVTELKKRNYKIHVTTNGNVFNLDVVNLIDTLSINFIAQSTTGVPTFWSCHPDVRDREIPQARFSFTLNKQTMRLLPAAIASTAEYGFGPLRINFMKAYTKEMLKYIITLDGKFEEWKKGMDEFAVAKSVGIDWPITRAAFCNYASDIVHIETNGAVMPCVSALERMGSVYEPFEEVWKNERYELFRKNTHRLCQSCIYCNSPTADKQNSFDQVGTVLPHEIEV